MNNEGRFRRHANPVRQIYFVRAVTIGLIKIGVANYAMERIVSLQTHSPDQLEIMGIVVCPNRGSLERTLHARFAHLRSHGEWFRPGPELLAYIAENGLTLAEAGAEQGRMIIQHEIDEDIRRRIGLSRAKAAGREDLAALFRKPRRGGKRPSPPSVLG